MENILVLNGSPRGSKGNTQVLVDYFLEGYKSAKKDVQIKQVELVKSNIKHCTGCFGCWTRSPGACVQSDDMDFLFKDYVNADVIIWATPLYHYGMTAIMKKFVERTLPLSQPQIVKIGDKFSHPDRFDHKQKHVVISNCGFPELQNFNVIDKSFERITGGVIASIYCVMGEILKNKQLKSNFDWYLDAVKKAGYEAAIDERVSTGTADLLKKPLMATEAYVDMANISWNINKEASIDKGYQFLTLMNYSFNSEAADGIEAVLEMTFTDTNEVCQFHIKDSESKLVKGHRNDFTTKIITTYDTWLDISEGRIDGAEAMMKGLYKVEGDLSFMMKLSQLYGEGNDETITLEDQKILGTPLSKWMGITFIPWTFSWIFLGKNILLGVWLPLFIMLGILHVKGKHRVVTYFEQSSALYFMVITFMNLLHVPFVRSQATLLNYFAIACIWGFSVLAGKALTSDYSKYNQEGDLSDNIIFIRTNDHLTLFWSGIFLIQGALHYYLESVNLGKFIPFIYILILLALKFTNWYSTWYPQKMMRA